MWSGTGQVEATARVEDPAGGFDTQTFTVDVVNADPAEIRGSKFVDENGDGQHLFRIFERNLIINGNAEAGEGAVTDRQVFQPIEGWDVTSNFTPVVYGTVDGSGSFPDLNDPGPADRGANFFAGGPSNPLSTAVQVIDVSSEAALIDNGAVTFDLSGYLGGFAGQRDNAVLTAVPSPIGRAGCESTTDSPFAKARMHARAQCTYWATPKCTTVPFGFTPDRQSCNRLLISMLPSTQSKPQTHHGQCSLRNSLRGQ